MSPMKWRHGTLSGRLGRLAAAWCEFALKIDPENLSIRKTMAFCLAGR